MANGIDIRLTSSTQAVDGSEVDWNSADFVWCTPEHRIAGFGVAMVIEAPGGAGAGALVAERLSQIQTDGVAPVAVGALPFDKKAVHRLVVPAVTYRRSAGGHVIRTAISGDVAERPAGGVPRIVDSQDEARWKEMVDEALEIFATGRARKIVLARQHEYDPGAPIDRNAVVATLRERAAQSFVFADGNFVGATPELLVRRNGTQAWSEPMAGTTPIEVGREIVDRPSVIASTMSDKKRDEHAPTRRYVANTLEDMGADVTVHSPEVRLYPTLAHLVTRIEATKEQMPDALSLAMLLHPTPAVGAAPDEAIDYVAQIEKFDRGSYAGPVGWVDAGGDGEWAIALRCGVLHGRTATLVAGAGITAMSEAHDEWVETESKMAVMIDAIDSSLR